MGVDLGVGSIRACALVEVMESELLIVGRGEKARVARVLGFVWHQQPLAWPVAQYSGSHRRQSGLDYYAPPCGSDTPKASSPQIGGNVRAMSGADVRAGVGVQLRAGAESGLGLVCRLGLGLGFGTGLEYRRGSRWTLAKRVHERS